MRGNEKAVLELTILKLVIANTVKFSCFYDEWREFTTFTTNPQQFGPVVDNPTVP
jgi:hypothetical protein